MPAQFRSHPGHFKPLLRRTGAGSSVLSYFLRKKGPMDPRAHGAGGFVKPAWLESAPLSQIGKPVFNGWRRQDRGL